MPYRTNAAPTSLDSGLRVLLCSACVIVIVAGLKASGPVLVPIIVALFLSLLCIPPMSRLMKMGVPESLAILIVMTLATVVVLLVTMVVGNSVQEFQGQIGHYRLRLDEIVGDALAWAQARGIEVDTEKLKSKIDTGAIMQLAASTAGGLLSILSNFFLVILTMIFILFEATCFKNKLLLAKGDPIGPVHVHRSRASNMPRWRPKGAFYITTGSGRRRVLVNGELQPGFRAHGISGGVDGNRAEYHWLDERPDGSLFRRSLSITKKEAKQ